MSPVKFKLLVEDAYREGGTRAERIVEVIALSYDDAQQAYFTKCPMQEVSVAGIIDVTQMTNDDILFVINNQCGMSVDELPDEEQHRLTYSFFISGDVCSVMMMDTLSSIPMVDTPKGPRCENPF